MWETWPEPLYWELPHATQPSWGGRSLLELPLLLSSGMGWFPIGPCSMLCLDGTSSLKPNSPQSTADRPLSSFRSSECRWMILQCPCRAGKYTPSLYICCLLFPGVPQATPSSIQVRDARLHRSMGISLE